MDRNHASLVGVLLSIALALEVNTQPNSLPIGQKLYVFSIPQNADGSNYSSTVFISSEHAVAYRVRAPTVGLDRTGSLKGSWTSISLDSQLEMTGTGVSRNAVTIQSNASLDVHLLAHNYSKYHKDMLLIEPLDPNFKNFFAMTFSGTDQENQFSVNVPLDNTEVHIQLKSSRGSVTFDGRYYTNGQSIRKTLNAYDVLQIQCAGDLTGTYIESSKPISVISGNKCMSIRGSCDFAADSIIPVHEWGTKYITSKFENDGIAVVKILASEDGTTLKINGRNGQRSLNRDEFYEERLTQSTVLSIQANKPVSVAQFYDLKYLSSTADPFMVILPSIDQYDSSYSFEVPTGYGNYFLVIYVERAKINGIRLDGQNVYFTSRKSTNIDITGQSFIAGQLAINAGKHTLTHTVARTRFGAMLYGLKSSNSFGAFLGYSYGPSCNPTCDHGGICVTENTCHCQLGYYGQYCQLGNGILDDLKPVLYAPINGSDDNYMDPLSWYSDSPLSSLSKVCFVKVLVKNASKDTIVKAVSSTTDGVEYGNFTVGPIDITAGISGLTRFACLEVRCPFMTMDGYYKNTVVNISLSGSNDNQCHIGQRYPHKTNFTIQSEKGQADTVTVVLEVENNYGPYFGVYMAIGDRQKAKFLAEHKCYSGREYDYTSYNPEIGVLTEFDC